MANKKARNKSQELDFDLPPSALAKTTNLSATKQRKRKSRTSSSKKSWEAEDDTPKAFARLMSGGSRPRSGLDNGETKKQLAKKRKLTGDGSGGGDTLKQTRSELKIQPGESLREFGRRVDAAIPVHFPKRDGSVREGKKKKLKKEEEVVDKNEEPEEGEEVHSDDDDEMKEQLRQAREGFEAAKRRKGGRKRGDSPDPWADLERKREAIRFGEVAPAPPVLKKPKALLYMAGAKAAVDVDGVPRSAGSLAKREELAGERRSIVEAYRLMMEGKRAEEKKAR